MTRSLENLINELEPYINNEEENFNLEDFLMYKNIEYLRIAEKYSESDLDAFAFLYAMATNTPIYYEKTYDGYFQFYGSNTFHPYTKLSTTKVNGQGNKSKYYLEEFLAEEIIKKFGFNEKSSPLLANILKSSK